MDATKEAGEGSENTPSPTRKAQVAALRDKRQDRQAGGVNKPADAASETASIVTVLKVSDLLEADPVRILQERSLERSGSES